MQDLGLSTEIVDQTVVDNTIARFSEQGITLPTFSQLRDPATIPAEITAKLADIGPDDPHPLNLFRVHWFNAADRKGRVDVPGHIVLPKAITGVDAKIIVALGNRFPMINAHKVLAAYGCLAPRLLTGQFDPTAHRAVWPSTGNYCRGGVAISRIMGCRGVAVLPEGMSKERFDWLEHWVTELSDIIRTPGTESNVKEIYDCCNALSQDDENVILNQFSEFGNHLVHYLVTGSALAKVYEHVRDSAASDLELVAFVSATGSAGTIAAGDYLRDELGSRTVAVEAVECPTMLYNGFGEHNIQGIGDKHIPLIHNVMATDFVAGVSDRATDQLLTLLNTDAGQRYLAERKGLSAAEIESLSNLGLSSLCNITAAIKTAKYLGLGADQAVITVATDGAAMYTSERDKVLARDFGGEFDIVNAGEVYGEHVTGIATDHFQELGARDRDRILNLGYFTWVEQQGISVESFEARRKLSFWRGLRSLLGTWDERIADFNRQVAEA